NAVPRASRRIAPTYNLVDDFTYTAGRHSWQAGFNLRFIRNERVALANNPGYSFSRNTLKGLGSDIVAAVNTAATAKYGVDIPSSENVNATHAMGALLGFVNSYSATFEFGRDGSAVPFGSEILRSYATNELEFYFQDTFRMRRDLTINYGIRYSNY